MKLSVIFDSVSGNTRRAAEWITAGMNEVEGAEAKAFHINDIDEDFVKASKGIVLGSPSYSASMTPAMRNWLSDPGQSLEMPGKLGGAFATVQYTHGGGELVIQSLLTIELAYGMLCYSSGRECGKPYIHLGPVGVNSNLESHNDLENYREYFTVYGRRFAQKAKDLFL